MRLPLAALTLCLLVVSCLFQPTGASQSPMDTKGLGALSVSNLPQGRLYEYHLPADSSFRAKVAVSDRLQTISGFYKQGGNPPFVINGGFFDPANQKTTAYVQLNGQVVVDPRQNENLTGNPKLSPYLEKIFRRTEFRIYRCGQEIRYDIAGHADGIPVGCRLEEAMGAGPKLLPRLTDREEAFTDYDSHGKLIRDPIGVCRPNARSVVGLTANGEIIFLMGAQVPGKPKSGFTLEEMADLLKARGAVRAMALDGGGSSGIVVSGKPYYGEFDSKGNPVVRRVKSVLLIAPR
jgi:hypothetical protein